MKKNILTGLILVGLALPACCDTGWVRVRTGLASTTLKVTGKIIPQEGALSVESALIQGRIVNILKREGEMVAVNEPLFTISSAECILLQEQKHVAESRGLDELEEAVKRREKTLNLIVSNNECVLLSNHSGTLNKINVGSGASFNFGDVLASVLDVTQLTMQLDVPESDLFKVKPGQGVKVQFSSSPENTYRTTVLRILPNIDPNTRTVKVRLKPLERMTGAVLDALVYAEISTGSEERLLQVPSSALVFSNNQQYVVKKVGNQPKAVAVEVIDESENDSLVRAITAGQLSAGDPVAVSDSLFLFRQIQATQKP